MYKRDISEIYVNTYNKEWLTAWDGNIDIQPCFEYFGVITYITDYFTKDDSGTLKYIKEALKASRDDLKEKLRLVVHQFLTHRQIGESEAYYRILSSLHLKSSNTECKFLSTGFKSNRSTFLEKLDDEKAKYVEGAIQVEGKDGYYFERPTLIDKYLRMDLDDTKEVEELSYTQFGQRYVSSRTGPKNDKNQKEKDSDNECKETEEGDEDEMEENEQLMKPTLNEMITKISGKSNTIKIELPKFIKLKNLKPGEPPFMKRRSPYVIRFHKINSQKNHHEYIFSQLQCYTSFRDEEDLFPEDYEKCLELYNAEITSKGPRAYCCHT